MSVVTVAIGVALASGYWVVLLDRRIDEGRRGEREFTESAWRVTVSLSELRAAQQAFVAAEADRTRWAERVAARMDATLAGLGELDRLVTETGAARAVEDASAAVGDLLRVDAVAREYVAAGDEALAQALLVSDGVELGREAAGHVERALALERGTRNGSVAQQRTRQGRAFLTAVGGGVLAAVLLLPAAFTQGRARDDEAADALEDVSGPDAGQASAAGNLLDLTLAAEPAAVAGPPPAAAVAAPEPAVPDLDLPAAAVVCTDLGSLASAAELPELLARAAAVLNASGMIVWVSDGSGETLRPAVGHGYSQARLARLGGIPHDGENATASAYREGRMHVVPADASGTGAIAAPLISSVNCFGVLSAELREGWEARPDVQSLTRILAAQLATLVAPDANAQAASRRAQA